MRIINSNLSDVSSRLFNVEFFGSGAYYTNYRFNFSFYISCCMACGVFPLPILSIMISLLQYNQTFHIVDHQILNYVNFLALSME